MMIGRRIFLVLAAATLTGACMSSVPSPPPVATTIYLVRHAEKDIGDDPGLTGVGHERAAALARLLADAGLVAIYATDTRRARETAAPSAAAAGLAIMLYDPRAPEAFTAGLRSLPGAALVVGHSNTTPALVEWLGGVPGAPIDEATEFDRIYTIGITAAGTSTRQATYGPN